jgi:hypothetical protein
MGLGITETIGLAATLVFALPAGILGVQLFVGGQRFLGGVLVVFAALMVLVPRYVVTPDDVPGAVLGRVVGAAVDDPDDDE